ncbi:hypothetical protein QEH59_13395 [Coraliomargarita sp. SDUM461004]|uniref:Uncharacterized protein n=1 Tax=Thalassobacterium sedimentorum TaxID=3041258 RepID=A0ABU1AKT6_9BACT|nr:hypothetical protein [Coraliomargarita sp. SDUM461004]
MKSLLSTLFLNLGMHKKSAHVDQVLSQSEEKTSVDAATPTCLPTV